MKGGATSARLDKTRIFRSRREEQRFIRYIREILRVAVVEKRIHAAPLDAVSIRASKVHNLEGHEGENAQEKSDVRG